MIFGGKGDDILPRLDIEGYEVISILCMLVVLCSDWSLSNVRVEFCDSDSGPMKPWLVNIAIRGDALET